MGSLQWHHFLGFHLSFSSLNFSFCTSHILTRGFSSSDLSTLSGVLIKLLSKKQKIKPWFAVFVGFCGINTPPQLISSYYHLDIFNNLPESLGPGPRFPSHLFCSMLPSHSPDSSSNGPLLSVLYRDCVLANRVTATRISWLKYPWVTNVRPLDALPRILLFYMLGLTFHLSWSSKF